MKPTLIAALALLGGCGAPTLPALPAREAQQDLLEQAVARLAQACIAQPANADAWQRLSGALAAQGDQLRAQAAAQQASSLRTHDLGEDYALLERNELHVLGPALVELRRVPAAAHPPAAAIPAAAASTALLEISNGNGVRGFAASWARRLQGAPVRLVRLTNTRPFAVQRTRVEYRDSNAATARFLAEKLGVPGAPLAQAGTGRADVRIVLGRDLLAPAQKKPPASSGRQAP